MHLYMYISIHLYLSTSIYLSKSIYLSIHVSIFIFLSICLSVYLRRGGVTAARDLVELARVLVLRARVRVEHVERRRFCVALLRSNGWVPGV